MSLVIVLFLPLVLSNLKTLFFMLADVHAVSLVGLAVLGALADPAAVAKVVDAEVVDAVAVLDAVVAEEVLGERHHRHNLTGTMLDKNLDTVPQDTLPKDTLPKDTRRTPNKLLRTIRTTIHSTVCHRKKGTINRDQVRTIITHIRILLKVRMSSLGQRTKLPITE